MNSRQRANDTSLPRVDCCRVRTPNENEKPGCRSLWISSTYLKHSLGSFRFDQRDGLSDSNVNTTMIELDVANEWNGWRRGLLKSHLLLDLITEPCCKHELPYHRPRLLF